MGFQNGAIGQAAHRLARKDIKQGKEPALNRRHILERTAQEITQKYRHATEDHAQVKKFCLCLTFLFIVTQKVSGKLPPGKRDPRRLPPENCCP